MTRANAERKARRLTDKSRRGGAAVDSFKGPDGRCWLGVRDTVDTYWIGVGSRWSIALKRFKEEL